MPVDFKFKAETSSLSSGVATLAERAGEWRGAWPKVSNRLTQIVSQVFESGGARGQRDAWAPLSEKYARRKARRFPGQPILQATGRLWRSLTGQGEDSVEEQGPTSLRVGTRVPYAQYLQSGTGKGMPQRVLLDLAPGDQSDLASAILQQGFDFAARAGFAASNQGGAAPKASQSIAGGPVTPLSGGI